MFFTNFAKKQQRNLPVHHHPNRRSSCTRITRVRREKRVMVFTFRGARFPFASWAAIPSGAITCMYPCYYPIRMTILLSSPSQVECCACALRLSSTHARTLSRAYGTRARCRWWSTQSRRCEMRRQKSALFHLPFG
jgi:hypothetical protein